MSIGFSGTPSDRCRSPIPYNCMAYPKCSCCKTKLCRSFLSMQLVKRRSLFLRSASAAGIGRFDSSCSWSTIAYSSPEAGSFAMASSTLGLNLYGLAVDAIKVFVVSPVALR